MLNQCQKLSSLLHTTTKVKNKLMFVTPYVVVLSVGCAPFDKRRYLFFSHISIVGVGVRVGGYDVRYGYLQK